MRRLAPGLVLAVIVAGQSPLAIDRLLAEGKFAEAREWAIRSLAGRSDPAERAQLLFVAGSAGLHLGLDAEALDQLTNAWRLIDKPAAGTADLSGAILMSLAEGHLSRARPEEAMRWLSQASAVAAAWLSPTHPLRVRIHLCHSRLALARQQAARAVAEARRALELARAVHGPSHPMTATAMNALAFTLDGSAATEAIPLVVESHRIFSSIDPAHPEAVLALYLHGLFEVETAPAEAEKRLEASLRIWLSANPERRPQTVRILQALALAQSRQRRHADALRSSSRASALALELAGAEHPFVTRQMRRHAGLLRAAGQKREASKLEDEAERIRRRHGHPLEGLSVDAAALRSGH